MALTDASHFDRLIEFLRQKRENVTFHDIITLAEVAARKAGVDNYIVKPFNAATLQQKINAVISGPAP